ncbi:MAG: hypothetical protein QOG53_3034 [Frankiales bacterium]|nr:hypothetical protein [Frankiales bacterium]
MHENYVRPPIVGREPAPRWVALWRFRIITLIIAIALGAGVALLMLKYVVHTEQNPSFGSTRATQSQLHGVIP